MKRIKNSKAGIIVTAAIAIFALAGCGSSQSATSTSTSSNSTTSSNSAPQQDAGEFMKELVNQTVLGQWGRRWETLLPAEQEVVSRDAYMTCRQKDDIPASMHADIIEEYKESIDIPGVGNMSTTAVTVKLMADDMPDQNITGHLVAIDGKWHWMVSSDEFKAYKSGNCP